MDSENKNKNIQHNGMVFSFRQQNSKVDNLHPKIKLELLITENNLPTELILASKQYTY
jgi:hypothetical protein